MKITKPAYYDSFRCLAGACPDSCCQEWDVQVDEASALRYLALPGPLGDKLREKLHLEDGEYYLQITDRRCPMWRLDGLCRIQAELGEEALCHTCRDFPRLRHDYGNFVELGLELSCPEAARLILSQPDAPSVVTDVPGGDAPEYDSEVMQILLRTRREALKLLEQPVPQALVSLLLYAYQVQEEIDGGEAALPDPAADWALAQKLAAPASAEALRQFYLDLEILTPRWRQLLCASTSADQWDPGLLAIVRYAIGRYWLQAVSDLDIVCRVKMIVAACILLRELGGPLLQTAQLYSKEIENSAENVDAILDAAYTHPAFTDVYLIRMLTN